MPDFSKTVSMMTFIGWLVLMNSESVVAKELRQDMNVNSIKSSVIITTESHEIESAQFIFGSQTFTLTSSEMEGGMLLDFGSLSDQENGQKLDDFDGDNVNDSVTVMVCSPGSSANAMYFIVSSSTRKAWLYFQSGGGNGYWAGTTIPLPEIKQPFIIFEELDYMPRFPGIENVEMVHPEEIGFIFTRVWDGNGFSYRPVIEFYKALLPQIEQAIKEQKNKDIRRMYKRIEIDFKKAANGQEISPVTMKSSRWRLVKAFDTEPARIEAKNANDQLGVQQNAQVPQTHNSVPSGTCFSCPTF